VTTLVHNCNAVAAQPQAFRAAAPVGPTAFLGCTQMSAQCPTYPSGDCTFFGCPPTPATVCTQIGIQCRSAVDACPTRLCGRQAFGAAVRGPIGPTGFLGCTQAGLQCPTLGCRNDTYWPCTRDCPYALQTVAAWCFGSPD
jgi:hypothetical protein